VADLLDKFIGSNMDVGGNCCDGLVLGVLVIAGDHLDVICLLKGYACNALSVC